MSGGEFATYLEEQIRYWEDLREQAWPYTQGDKKHQDGVLAHDKFSIAAQVLLSALWELNGEMKPTMREIMEKTPGAHGQAKEGKE